MRKRRLSLITKIILLITLVLITVNIAGTVFISKEIRKLTTSEMNKNILNTLNGISANIDGSKIQDIINNEGKDKDKYNEVNKYLKKALDNCDFEYLYTVYSDQNGSFKYLVDSLSEKDEDFSALGELVETRENDEIKYKYENDAINLGSSISDINFFGEWGYIVTAYSAIYNDAGKPVALLGADINADDYNKVLNTITYIIIFIFAGITLIIIIVVSVYLSKRLKPMMNIQKAAVEVSNGNLNINLTVKSNDEIGQAASAFNEMVKKLRGIVINISDDSKKLNSFSNDLKSGSELFSLATEQVTKDVIKITETTEEEYKSIKLILNNTETINNNINGIENKVEGVLTLVQNSLSNSQNGEEIIKSSAEVITNANTSMEVSKNRILKLSDEIDKVNRFIEVVTDISNQTNLLALNAAIEAARAGEFGKGFSVVADEVRKLADESSVATKEITDILQNVILAANESITSIDDTYKKILEGVEVTKKAERYFGEILEDSSNIQENTNEIFEAIKNSSKGTSDILNAVIEAEESIKNLNETCQSISGNIEEQFATSEEIHRYAVELNNMSKKLDQEIDVFKI